MPLNTIRQPSSGEIIELTDWIEATMVAEQRNKISRSRLRRYFRNMMIVDENDLEIHLELIFQEINRRKQITQNYYPFSEEGSGTQFRSDEETLPYIFLLLLTMSEPLRSEKRQGEVEILLDMLVLDALSQYLSGESKGVRFGWPRSGDHPPSFPQAIEWLAGQLGLPVGKGEKRLERKDAGVDVVVWRPFRDEREGYVTILAQCTVAFDWAPKAKDIIIDLWRGYIDFGKDPIICIAIPFVIPQPFAKWDELRRTVHFVLDRLRICELIGNSELKYKNEITDWISTELEKISEIKKS